VLDSIDFGTGGSFGRWFDRLGGLNFDRILIGGGIFDHLKITQSLNFWMASELVFSRSDTSFAVSFCAPFFTNKVFPVVPQSIVSLFQTKEKFVTQGSIDFDTGGSFDRFPSRLLGLRFDILYFYPLGAVAARTFYNVAPSIRNKSLLTIQALSKAVFFAKGGNFDRFYNRLLG
jgi:hypothetical protein